MYLSLAFIVLSLKTRPPRPLLTTAYLKEELNNAMPGGKMSDEASSIHSNVATPRAVKWKSFG